MYDMGLEMFCFVVFGGGRDMFMYWVLILFFGYF